MGRRSQAAEQEQQDQDSGSWAGKILSLAVPKKKKPRQVSYAAMQAEAKAKAARGQELADLFLQDAAAASLADRSIGGSAGASTSRTQVVILPRLTS
jgi:hypothetical protein